MLLGLIACATQKRDFVPASAIVSKPVDEIAPASPSAKAQVLPPSANLDQPLAGNLAAPLVQTVAPILRSRVTEKGEKFSDMTEEELLCQLSAGCEGREMVVKTNGATIEKKTVLIARQRLRPSRSIGNNIMTVIGTRRSARSLSIPPRDNTAFLPWPPPRPTSMILVKSVPLKGKYRDILVSLQLKLRQAGYENVRYFAIPDGVGMVTEIERIGPGRIQSSSRWGYTKHAPVFSFGDYFRNLFYGSVGQYYVAVILIADGPVSPSSENVRAEDVQRWRTTGEFYVSERRESVAISDTTRVWLLNYEFRVSQGARRVLVPQIESSMSSLRHLQRLRLK